MIYDNYSNKEKYYAMHDGFKLGFDFIEKAISENLAIGKYEIDGKRVWASVQEYLSKDEAKAEAHRKYIDIQYIVCGREQMKCACIDTCQTKVEYNEEKDVEFFEPASSVTMVCEKGDFAIFYPNDVHTPSLKITENEQVKKIVVKVQL